MNGHASLGSDRSVILTGAGEKAFCTGGDVKQRAETGDYGPSELGRFRIGELPKLIRDITKPVMPTGSWPRPRSRSPRWQRSARPRSASSEQSFNADTDHQAGFSNMAMTALDMFAVSREGMEGAHAFAEKRQADFAPHVHRH